METSRTLGVIYELEVVLSAGGSRAVAGYRVTCGTCGATVSGEELSGSEVIVHSRLHDPERGATTPVVRPDGTTVYLVLCAPTGLCCAFCGGYKGPTVPIGTTEDLDLVVAHVDCVPHLW